MSLLSLAWKDLQRNTRTTVGYVLCVMAVVAPVAFLSQYLGLHVSQEEPPSWLPLYTTAADIYLVAVFSLAQTCFFFYLGCDLDRPVWRCGSLRDALARFYHVWILVNLITLLFIRAQTKAAVAGLPDLVALLEMLVLFSAVLLPVVGVCVMHYGKLEWANLGIALRPLVRQPLLTFQIATIHLGAYLLHLAAMEAIHAAPETAGIWRTVIMAPQAFLELFAFAATWRVCMHHRDHAQQLDSDPYDF